MHPAETYRRRAERAERACENARTPDAKRLARTAAQRWRELAELAERREAEGPPIPIRFGDASEAVNYAQDHKFALYWKGTHAMYLGSTLYRIHGSNDPDSVGEAESSGCFRMRNVDIVDLYARVPVGTTVVVQ